MAGVGDHKVVGVGCCDDWQVWHVWWSFFSGCLICLIQIFKQQRILLMIVNKLKGGWLLGEFGEGYWKSPEQWSHLHSGLWSLVNFGWCRFWWLEVTLVYYVLWLEVNVVLTRSNLLIVSGCCVQRQTWVLFFFLNLGNSIFKSYDLN